MVRRYSPTVHCVEASAPPLGPCQEVLDKIRTTKSRKKFGNSRVGGVDVKLPLTISAGTSDSLVDFRKQSGFVGNANLSNSRSRDTRNVRSCTEFRRRDRRELVVRCLASGRGNRCNVS